ncbi:MAG: hypothetical protein RL077_5957, partial [Verrucomicrobiota bacterium]
TVADPGIHRVGWRKEATGAEVRGAHGEEIDWGVVAAGAVIAGARHDILGRLIHDKWEERAV